MINLNTNLSSLIAQGSLKESTLSLNQAIERMSTGFKINHASDNAANYSISTNMTTKIGAYQVAEENAAMGLDLLATAEGTLSQISDKLSRLRALAVQVENGTYGGKSLQAINAEANALVDEIDRIYKTAEYNGISLFNSTDELLSDKGLAHVNTDGFINDVIERDLSDAKTLESVDGEADLVDGVYTISTAKELEKLATMTNSGYVSVGDEFVLTSDIDLSSYDSWVAIGNGNGSVGNAFKGVFDGNGHKIYNLKIESDNSSTTTQGLFGNIAFGTVKNLGLEDVDISINQAIGAISTIINKGTIDNCYVTGNIESTAQAGGVASDVMNNTVVANSYVEANIKAPTVGGFASWVSNAKFENCFVDSTFVGNETGGIIGTGTVDGVNIKNCYVLGESNLKGVFVAVQRAANRTVNIENCVYNSYYASKSIELVGNDFGTNNISEVSVFDLGQTQVGLQVGINEEETSRLSFSLDLDLSKMRRLNSIGKFEMDYLEEIDNIISQVSSKQTEIGSVSNRLCSVLDEIEIQYDNLVSSRSTLRDADITEVSAEYIQQQILQQASATLLATANQSPSIALQLI